MVRLPLVLAALTLFLPGAALAQSSREPVISKYSSADASLLKAVAKPGGPPAVSVECQPAGDGQFQLKVRFYADGGGKLKQVSFTGELADIEVQVQAQAKKKQLSPRVAELVQVALKRLQAIQKPAASR